MLKDNLHKVQTQIAEALSRRTETKLTGDKVTLVAVTKNHPVDVVLESLALGVTNIGENRVQEAKEKRTIVPDRGFWHLIGHLQTNKAKQAVTLFDLIESADSEHLLAALDKAAGQQHKQQDILLQLNIAREEQKTGFLIEDYLAILPQLDDYKNLCVRGLMVIAPLCGDIEETRPVFKEGYRCFCELRAQRPGIELLSMGMTHDFTVAVEEGANIVRVGTALFGKRDYSKINEHEGMVKCMKFFDRISETLGLYEEEDDELLEEEEPVKKAETAPKRIPRSTPAVSRAALSAESAALEKSEARSEVPAEKKSFFSKKNVQNSPEGKTISMPLAQKQVKVVVLEPANFDDSQKVADYLRNNQPVVVNFEGTEGLVTKRMTDFISGTIYALGGSMKKIGRNILVCAPKNVDIDASVNIYDEKGGQPWKK